MSDPSSKLDDVEKDSDEWFEIFNSSGVARDLSEIQYDTDDDASDGVSLSGKLASGAYAIVANKSVDLWQELYGKLPKETLFIQVDSPWKILSNKADSLLTLFDRSVKENIFHLAYGESKDGHSLEYMGKSVEKITPYFYSEEAWQVAALSPGGASGDFHSAGISNLQAAPEPSAVALLGLAALGLVIATRRQCLHPFAVA